MIGEDWVVVPVGLLPFSSFQTVLSVKISLKIWFLSNVTVCLPLFNYCCCVKFPHQPAQDRWVEMDGTVGQQVSVQTWMDLKNKIWAATASALEQHPFIHFGIFVSFEKPKTSDWFTPQQRIHRVPVWVVESWTDMNSFILQPPTLISHSESWDWQLSHQLLRDKRPIKRPRVR